MLHTIEPTDYQQQVIFGTILGGSSIIKPKNGKHAYLAMRDRDARWLEYKGEILRTLTSPEPFTLGNTNRWHSFCLPFFDTVHDKFYRKDKRLLKTEILDSFRDIGIAAWFGDSAKKTRRGILLNTHVWGLKGTKTIKEYLELSLIGESEIVMSRGCYRLKLKKQTTINILKLIEHCLPSYLNLRPEL